MQKLRVLDLFSGIGGFSLGLEWTGGFETVAFCEIEKYPQEVLGKNFPGVPIYDDIKELTAERLISDGIGTIDVITGGYPCQPFSVAGKQKGEKDDRHLWPSMLEIITQVRPAWVISENVYGHIALGLDTVLLDLENEGYSTRTFIVPACSVNAPHKRDRLWIVAHANSQGESDGPIDEQQVVGNTEHNGSSPSAFKGRNGKADERTSERSEQTIQSPGASRSRHDGNVADSNNGCSEIKDKELFTGRQTSSGSSARKKDDSDSNSKRLHREEKQQQREAEPPDREIGDAGQVCEVLAGSGDSIIGNSEDVADSESQRVEGCWADRQQEPSIPIEQKIPRRDCAGISRDHWAVEPGMGRVAHGVSGRVAKLKALGNAVVPQIPMMIGQAILDYEQNKKV